jgi:hypothetical protein
MNSKKSIYAVFDSFLAIHTWYTGHYRDNERFFRALHQVVKDPDFNPDSMVEYMRGKMPNDPSNIFHSRIEQLQGWAWGIKDYLAANKL